VVEALERRDLMPRVLEQERELGAYGRVVLDQADLCRAATGTLCAPSIFSSRATSLSS
jgi:hypothetical protein